MSNKKITVLDLRDSAWVDGPGRTILDCAESLNGKDFHFIIGSFSGGIQKTTDYVDEASSRGLTVETIVEKSAFDKNVVKQIDELIIKHNVSIIHAHDFRSNIFSLYCGWKAKLPVITTVHGWIANNIKGKIYRAADKFLLRFFKHIISVSDRTRKLIRWAFISEKKITVINNALTVEKYKIKNNRKEFCESNNLKQDTVLIANIGRLSPEKGQLEFLQACNAIIKKGYKITALLVGIGPDKEMLESYVKQNDMASSVVFLGYRTDMVEIYNAVDLIVQSSYTEGMPNVMLEALLMQKPVIATDVGGTNQVVVNAETGMLIPPGKTNILCEHIKNYLDDKSEYEKMAINGRQHIQRNFNHEKRVQQLSDVYMNVVKDH